MSAAAQNSDQFAASTTDTQVPVPKRHENVITTIMWLHILREGGRWTMAELQAALPQLRTRNVSAFLATMKAGGYLQRHRRSDQPRCFSYGVSSSCKVPQGIVLQELIDMGVVRLDPVAAEEPNS